MYCSKCGSENSEDAAFCNSCGSDLRASDTKIDEKIKNVSSEKTKKKMSLGLIAGWFFGIIFLLQGISYILAGPFLAGIALLLASMISLPPLNNSLENRLNISLSRGLRIFIVFLLLIFASMGVAAVVANNNNDNYNPSSSSSSTTETQSQYYSIGDKVTVGDITYIVNDVSSTSAVGNSFASEEADGIYLIVDLTIENNGDESTNLYSSYVQVVDSQGRIFESDSIAAIYLEDNLAFKQLQPGLPTSGTAIFDVPTGESFVLEVTDSLWGTNTKYITLGST